MKWIALALLLGLAVPLSAQTATPEEKAELSRLTQEYLDLYRQYLAQKDAGQTDAAQATYAAFQEAYQKANALRQRTGEAEIGLVLPPADGPEPVEPVEPPEPTDTTSPGAAGPTDNASPSAPGDTANTSPSAPGTGTTTGTAGTGGTTGTRRKVTLCHRTRSTRNPWVRITIAEAAVPTHLAHGDRLAVEGEECGGGTPREPRPEPSREPRPEPSREPREEPSAPPEPSREPREEPSASPKPEPSREPREEPSAPPKDEPVKEPSPSPTTEPGTAPSKE